MEEGGIVILRESPDYFANVLCKLRVCHDLCVYSSVTILSSKVKGKIEQCSVDFRHVSKQTATLAERIGSNWCGTCITFFGNMDKIKGDPSKVLNRISVQAKELSSGFNRIAEWIRDLAGRFHECQQLAGNDKKAYMDKVKEAADKAIEAEKKAEEKREAARKELEASKKSARTWGICACIPVVQIVAAPGYLMARDGVQDARLDEQNAERALATAKSDLNKARDAQKEAEVAAELIAELILALKQVEKICENQAAFWDYQSDKFGSFSVQVTTSQDLLEIGLDDSIDELVEWLRKRRDELKVYHEVMQGVNNSYNFPCAVRPTQFPRLALPSLDIVLS